MYDEENLQASLGKIPLDCSSAYRMVPHESPGMLPLMRLYGQEALIPIEIKHTTYGLDSDYEKALGGKHQQDVWQTGAG